MGQKGSSSHSSSEISLSKKDSRNYKLKTKKCSNWSREKINVDVQPNLANTFADTEKLDDDDTRKNADDDDDNTVETNLLAYPSIAELSNFTALSMMRNLENVSLKNQLNETNEKLMDDDFNEKCFNTINYEDMPVIQLVENTTSLRRDSSTCTNEIKELSRDNSLEDVDDDVAEKLSSKDSEQSVVCYHQGEMEKSELDEMEEETLEAKLERTERERDEAISRLRIVEVRCEAYEEESKCLEASMLSMEEKLRTIVNELHNEVTRSKNLERQLSTSFQNSAVDIPTEGVDSVEKLVSQALHS